MQTIFCGDEGPSIKDSKTIIRLGAALTHKTRSLGPTAWLMAFAYQGERKTCSNVERIVARRGKPRRNRIELDHYLVLLGRARDR
jgi:hypothetical protein